MPLGAQKRLGMMSSFHESRKSLVLERYSYMPSPLCINLLPYDAPENRLSEARYLRQIWGVDGGDLARVKGRAGRSLDNAR